MFFKVPVLVVLALVGQTISAPSPAGKPHGGKGRPSPFPFHAGKPHTPSPPCTKSCTVAKPRAAIVRDNVTTPYDSSKDILNAVHNCNPGGVVNFEKSETYSIGTALNLTNLKNVDLNIEGTIKVAQLEDIF